MKKIFRRINRQSQQIINLLAPTVCLLCGWRLKGELLCPACELALPHLPPEACRQCALPLPEQSSTEYCGQCLHTPPPFTQAVIPFCYQPPLDYLIHSFKYRRQLTAGRLLAQTLETCLRHSYAEQERHLPDLILPVPLHWSRRWLRGFNQTEILGRHLSRQLKIPLHTRLCRRTGRATTQQGLSRIDRQKNLRKLFTLSEGGKDVLAGKTVALLDDVVTTTATTREISRLLLEQGAGEVHVWALARTPALRPD